jgi:hypothetical protein
MRLELSTLRGAPAVAPPHSIEAHRAASASPGAGSLRCPGIAILLGWSGRCSVDYSCLIADADGSGTISVDRIVTAVHSALTGCLG